MPHTTGNICCADANLPWFCKSLSHNVNKNIEVHTGAVMKDLEMKTFGVELPEIYIYTPVNHTKAL